LNYPSSTSLKLHVRSFENDVWDATALSRYTFHRTYFLFSKILNVVISYLQLAALVAQHVTLIRHRHWWTLGFRGSVKGCKNCWCECSV